jgi:hypothetical protein
MPVKSVLGVTLAAALLASATAARAEDDATCQAAYVAGQRRYKLEHDLIGGREQLLVCAKSCPDELRVSCGRWLQDIEAEVPSIVIKAKDAHGQDVLEVAVAIDGTAVAGFVGGSPIELNPGEHKVRVQRTGRAPVEQSVLVHAGEKLRAVDIWTEPRVRDEDVTRTRRPVALGTFVLAGVSAAALVSFGVFAIWTTTEYNATSSCRPNCAASGRDTWFSTKTAIADASLGLAAAALATAGVLYFVRPTITERVQKTSVLLPWAAPHGGGIALATSF